MVENEKLTEHKRCVFAGGLQQIIVGGSLYGWGVCCISWGDGLGGGFGRRKQNHHRHISTAAPSDMVLMQKRSAADLRKKAPKPLEEFRLFTLEKVER